MRSAESFALATVPPRRADPRSLERWRLRLLTLLLGAPLLIVLMQAAWSAIDVEAPGFVSSEQLAVGAPHAGRVARVFVAPMQDVSAGDPLALLVDDRLDARAAALRDRLLDVAGADARSPASRPRTPEIQRELALIEKERASLLVRAPKSGRVVSLQVFEGDHLAAGRGMLRIAPAAQTLHVDAWVAQRNRDYAEPGQSAVVTFADGAERAARIVDAPEAAHPLPPVLAGSYGAREPGVLVRLDFVDDGGPLHAPLDDGTRVKVRFRELQEEGLLSRVRHWWSAQT